MSDITHTAKDSIHYDAAHFLPENFDAYYVHYRLIPTLNDSTLNAMVQFNDDWKIWMPKSDIPRPMLSASMQPEPYPMKHVFEASQSVCFGIASVFLVVRFIRIFTS